ncbi:hypothetical protein N9N67_03625 [Bacteriovoracaceae bacterium]|nr:hypothetical protein [Bacteriovoracaceae bacterium]
MKLLMIFLISLSLASCSKSKNKKTNSKSNGKATEANNKAAPPLDCQPRSENFKIRLFSYDTNDEIHGETNLGEFPGGICATSTYGDDFINRENLPKIVLMGGSLDGIYESRSEIFNVTILSTLYSAGKIGRVGCVFTATVENFNKVAKMKKLEVVSFIGHGESGNLLDPYDPQHSMISPEDINIFQSKYLKKVGLISCQAGQKEDAWKKVFGENVKLDLSKENISVTNGLVYLQEDFLEDIETCQF